MSDLFVQIKNHIKQNSEKYQEDYLIALRSTYRSYDDIKYAYSIGSKAMLPIIQKLIEQRNFYLKEYCIEGGEREIKYHIKQNDEELIKLLGGENE